MCGISAWYKTGDETYFTKKVFNNTFKAISQRGHDASGIACLSYDKIKIIKDSMSSNKLTNCKNYEKIIRNPEIIIGHTRHATHGTHKDNRNNHPHYTADMRYVLIHNGVVLDRVSEIKTESECDSEILLRIIEKYGVKKGFERIGQLKNASFAIALIDTKYGALYFF